MNSVALVLATGSLSCYVYVLLCLWDALRGRPGTVSEVWGAAALGCVQYTIAALLWGDAFGARVFGAVSAIFIHAWFRGGGGKGPRKRLRSWVKKFKPVRRTAPVAGRA